MIQLINKLKKNQKGFTLVELIVVLVILAILAAFTIPAMLGFVNDSKNKAEIANAREVYVAAQGAASEMAAQGKKEADGFVWSGTKVSDDKYNAYTQKVIDLVNGDTPITPVTSTVAQAGQVQVTLDNSTGKVSQVVYGGQTANITINSTASGNDAVVEPRT